MAIRITSAMLKAAGVAVLLSVSGQSMAATYSLLSSAVTRVFMTNDGSVSGTTTTPATFGGCMIGVSPGPANGCTANYVTFDCNGSLPGTDQIRAYRMADIAQFAMALAKNVTIVYDNTKMINGYCLATRIDVVK